MFKATATLTIRNIDAAVRDRLRIRAARNGRSMEAELRVIVANAVADGASDPEESGASLVADIRRRFGAIGYADDLVAAIPPRSPHRKRPLPTFED